MKKIAVSLADFEEIINNNYIYVDKTKYLHQMVSKDKYYFLSRPRRFGKSLFISTLENFFKGKKDLFKDLYIYDKECNWEEYPIIKLDFNTIPTESRDILEESINKRLDQIAKKYNIDFEKDKAYYNFPKLVRELSNKYGKGVVVLIDEYDKPIISNIGRGEEKLEIAKENKDFLKIFYDNLKSLETNLRLVFMTGVSKFSKLSVFSTLNNLIELDMHPRFYTMLGYTEEELRANFKEYFDLLAKKLEIDIEILYDKFKQMYNGFRFSDEEEKLYNPYSVAKALDYQKIDNYWFESGTPTFLIDLIKEKGLDITNINNIEVGRSKLKAHDITKLKLVPLLFQTGYLTIKEIEDQVIYKLGYPNYEVEQGVSQNLLENMTEDMVETPIIHRIKKSLIVRDYDKFIDYMKSLFANISNINIPKDVKEREHFYHTIFYLTGVLFSDNNLNIYSELLTSEGRIDMVVESEENFFIIEFKCNQSAADAIEQIEERNYKDKYKIKEKEIVLIGINFDTKERNIKDYLIKN